MILRNIPELAQIYETKARAPYRVVFEVCRLSELKGLDLYSHERPIQPNLELPIPGKKMNGGTGSTDLCITNDQLEDEQANALNPFAQDEPQPLAPIVL